MFPLHDEFLANFIYDCTIILVIVATLNGIANIITLQEERQDWYYIAIAIFVRVMFLLIQNFAVRLFLLRHAQLYHPPPDVHWLCYYHGHHIHKLRESPHYEE